MASRIDVLKEKLFLKKCSPTELEELFELVKLLPEKEASPILTALWSQMKAVELERELSEKMYKNIVDKIDTSPKIIAPPPRRIFLRKMSSIAAVILLLLGVGIWFWANNAIQKAQIHTAYGEQQTIKLPDGSAVQLNANSNLVYAKSWKEQEKRKVWLEGEAYFKVEKKEQTNQKFQVIVEDLTIEVLGTAFNVNNNPSETTVFLEEGKIKLNFGKETRMMRPGDLFVWSSKEKKIVQHQKAEKEETHTSWKDGVLLFTNNSLKEVFDKIETIYGVECQFGKKVDLNRIIHTGLPMKKLDIVIPLLENALNLNITKQDNRLIITKK